jgi:hypothetical protein
LNVGVVGEVVLQQQDTSVLQLEEVELVELMPKKF